MQCRRRSKIEKKKKKKKKKKIKKIKKNFFPPPLTPVRMIAVATKARVPWRGVGRIGIFRPFSVNVRCRDDSLDPHARIISSFHKGNDLRRKIICSYSKNKNISMSRLSARRGFTTGSRDGDGREGGDRDGKINDEPDSSRWNKKFSTGWKFGPKDKEDIFTHTRNKTRQKWFIDDDPRAFAGG